MCRSNLSLRKPNLQENNIEIASKTTYAEVLDELAGFPLPRELVRPTRFCNLAAVGNMATSDVIVFTVYWGKNMQK